MTTRNRNLVAVLAMSALLIFATTPGLMAGDYHKSDQKAERTNERTSNNPWTGENTDIAEDHEWTDDSWVRVTGTVQDAEDEEFTLNYTGGKIGVDLDDWEWADDQRAYQNGDRVTVYGKIDDDFFQDVEIEAASIYLERDQNYYYGNRESQGTQRKQGTTAQMTGSQTHTHQYDRTMRKTWGHDETAKDGQMTIHGTVTNIRGNELTIDTGARDLVVTTDKMSNDQLNHDGFRNLDEGDRVCVRGNIDQSFWSDRELRAIMIVPLVTTTGSTTTDRDGSTATGGKSY